MVSFGCEAKPTEFDKNEIDESLSMNVIEPVQTEWVSPVAYALKKDGTLGSCVDYYTRNAFTVKYSYLLPRMAECIYFLEDTQMLSSLYA